MASSGKTTRKQMKLAKKRAKKAALNEKIDQLRGKELQAKSEAERFKHIAARKKLEYERDRIRLRARNSSK